MCAVIVVYYEVVVDESSLSADQLRCIDGFLK